MGREGWREREREREGGGLTMKSWCSRFWANLWDSSDGDWARHSATTFTADSERESPPERERWAWLTKALTEQLLELAATASDCQEQLQSFTLALLPPSTPNHLQHCQSPTYLQELGQKAVSVRELECTV